MKNCPDCGREYPQPPASRVCLWCFHVGLLAGGFIPDRLEDCWTDEELTLLKSRAASRRTRLLREATVQREQKRRLREEQAAVEGGQVLLV